jgi:NAD(P)-dependent dehydrogenase (short-subunit alcohol dehydrogenase family)
MAAMTEPRTSIVTGANTGIGKQTALELARRGDRVLLACRSEERTRPAVEEIVAATGNAEVSWLPLDLADLTTIPATLQSLAERTDRIDVLVANAGLAGQRGTTAQGFELAFGTNHLGHFQLVTGALPLLAAADAPRVVVVSSDSHYQAKGIPFEELRQPTSSITGLPEYAVSKLANVLFAQELARRTDPTLFVGSLHPGVIASDVWRRVPGPVRWVMTRFMKDTAQGASTSLLLATSDEVLAHRGAFWSEEVLKDPNPVATPALAAELWDRSERWCAELGGSPTR